MEQLWERSEEGRKETNRKLSTGTGKEGTSDRAGRNGENRGSESGTEHGKSHCEAKTGRAERKKQRLSSEMLKRKQTKGSGSQAPAPEEQSERGSPVERLRERSRAGRKETISKAKYGNPEGRHEKSGRREGGEPKERKRERGTGEATVRQKREERKGRNRRLSSRKES